MKIEFFQLPEYNEQSEQNKEQNPLLAATWDIAIAFIQGIVMYSSAGS